MKKLLSAASSLMILGAISFSSQPVLAGVDHLASSLLDVASHSKATTRALALRVVDDEMVSDLSQLIHDTITTGKVTTGAHRGKTVLEMIPIPQEGSIFSTPAPAIALTPFTLDANVPSNINRTVAHPLVVSLHFGGQAQPNYSGDLSLTCAGITARSTFSFAPDVLKPTNQGLIAGAIGMTGNNLCLSAEFETHLSSHVQALVDEIDRLRLQLEETNEALRMRQYQSNSAGSSSAAAYAVAPQIQRQIDLESAGLTQKYISSLADRNLIEFLTVPAEEMETSAQVKRALQAEETYKNEFMTGENETLWMSIKRQLHDRLSQLNR